MLPRSYPYRRIPDTGTPTGGTQGGGDTLALSLAPVGSRSLSVYDAHPKGNERLQEDRDTPDRLALLQALTKNYFNILIGKYFLQEGHTGGRPPRPVTLYYRHRNRGDRSPSLSLLLALAPPRSMMHTPKEMNAYRRPPTQEDRNTPDRLALLQALTKNYFNILIGK